MGTILFSTARTKAKQLLIELKDNQIGAQEKFCTINNNLRLKLQKIQINAEL